MAQTRSVHAGRGMDRRRANSRRWRLCQPIQNHFLRYANVFTMENPIENRSPTSDRRALPRLARSVTLAEIEASICYWRGQRRGHFGMGPAPGEEQAQVLEQLYARLLASREGAAWTAHLSVYEHDALLGGTRAIARSA
jgi:hypothetical protein